MAMSEDEFTLGAIELLHRFGVRVARVPIEADAKTPDLRGAGGPDLYAIELKQRDSDRVLNALPEVEPAALQQLAPFGLTRDRAVQSLIRVGAHQLRRELETTLRLIWVHCEGFDSESDQVQVQNSLLGSEYLLDRGEGGRAYLCHFFGESDFWRYRAELDGAIVSRQVDKHNVNFSFLLNPHSPRLDRLMSSTIATSIGANALVNVREEEAAGGCLIADCEIARGDSGAVLAYVRNKYGLDLVRVPIHRYGGVMQW